MDQHQADAEVGALASVAAAFESAFAPAGVLFGLAYVCILEALRRGRVTVVAPLIATESLWAVVFALVLLRRSEMIGRRIVAAAALVVAGGVTIGVWF